MGTTYTVLSIGDDERHAWRANALAMLLPRAEVRRMDAELVRRLPQAVALITATPAEARIARASGFGGGIVVHGHAPSSDEADSLRSIGAVTLAEPVTAAALGDALAAAVPLSPNGDPQSLPADLVRARRLLAAGEIAMTLQHTFNNPLSALLAEAQLLQMEAPTSEVRDGAGRVVELARRLIDISRSLDGVRERLPGS